MKDVSVAIDRILLTDLDLQPSDAERLGALIEAELKSLVEREGLPNGRQPMADHGVSLDLSNHLKEQQLARSVATRLWEALG